MVRWVLVGLRSGLLTKLVYASEHASLKLPIHWMWWPMLTACVEVAKRLNKVLRRHNAETRDDILAYAPETELGKFVLNLRHDMQAVQAALELPWTTSPAEGQINRLKIEANHVWQGRLQAAPRACIVRTVTSWTACNSREGQHSIGIDLAPRPSYRAFRWHQADGRHQPARMIKATRVVFVGHHGHGGRELHPAHRLERRQYRRHRPVENSISAASRRSSRSTAAYTAFSIS